MPCPYCEMLHPVVLQICGFLIVCCTLHCCTSPCALFYDGLKQPTVSKYALSCSSFSHNAALHYGVLRYLASWSSVH